MNKKFCILITDDWELLGDGSGNVALHQYLPGLFLLEIAKQLNLKMTFMVEVAQQLTFIEHQNEDSNIRIQRQLWDDTVRLMKANGCDVQLHLHPQWINATFKDGFFHVGKNRNLGTYEPSFQIKLLRESVDYLHTLLRPIDSTYKVHAFKAGYWGLQPFNNLQKHFSDFGIKLILGVRKGLKIPSASVDYDGLEEDTLPYYPDPENVNKLAADRTDVIILPLAYYSPDLLTLARLSLNLLKRKFLASPPDYPYLFPASPLSSDKLARMLRKIEGKEPVGNRIQQEVAISPGVLNETQQELLMLYRSKGRAIPPEIQAMLDDMRKRAAESKDEETDES